VASFAVLWYGVIGVSTLVAQASVRHPDRQYVDESVPVNFRLRLSGPRTPPGVVVGDVASVTIGSENGPDHSLFAEVTAVATTSNGTVVLLDRKTQDLRLFTSQGRFLQRLGRKGQGPGEFRGPGVLLVTPRDEIWVTDMQRRLTVFAPSPSGYRLARTAPTEIGIRSMCLLKGELVVNGVSTEDPYLVRVIDTLARPLRAFGKLYTSPNAMMNYQYSEGRVACDSENDIVVYASPAGLGEVRAFRRDGRPVWRTVIEDVRSNIVSETRDGITVERSPAGAHALLSLHAVPGLGVILQYDYKTREEMTAKVTTGQVLTIFLDPKTGSARLSSVAWPRLAAVDRGRAFVVFEDPVPHVELRALRQNR
jgi:hypothetical protein